MNPFHIPQHKQEAHPTTLKEAISFDQQRREAAYQEWLAAKQFYQAKQLKEQFE